jgi:hypothetical protein
VIAKPSIAARVAERSGAAHVIRIEPPRGWFNLRVKELRKYCELLQVVVTMNKLEFQGEKSLWSKPDSVTISAEVPVVAPRRTSAKHRFTPILLRLASLTNPALPLKIVNCLVF